MTLKKIIKICILLFIFNMLFTYSSKIDPCFGKPTEKCSVLPSLDNFFSLDFEICDFNPEFGVECKKVSF